MKKYYLIMERPVGSHTWTFAALAMDEQSANNKAKEITCQRKTCTEVISAYLPKKPDAGYPYAVMADGDTTFHLSTQ
jgi:hypothetical protein